MFKKITFLSYIIILIPVCFCENISFRNTYELVLSIDEENYYSWDVPESPYFVEKDVLQIYPNETVYIEVDNTNTIINEMKIVKDNINREKTIIIEFKQITKKENQRIHDMMILNIFNPLDYDLNYSCYMYLLKNNKWVRTSVIPVRATIGSYEIWPDIIITLLLQKFTLSEKQ